MILRLLILLLLPLTVLAADDTYTNPIIHADYSDPDVIRVGDDFYLTASSFNAIPGLPILHSKDLVNGRIIAHALPQPLRWSDDWPVIGDDADGDGKGEPVASYRKPNVGGVYPVQPAQTSDEFDDKLGLQWQWHANPLDSWLSFAERRGQLSLTAAPMPAGAKNLWQVPNLLLQKLPAENFTITTLVDISHLRARERSGLLMMGREYSYLAVVKTQNGARLVHVVCHDALNGTAETESSAVHLRSRMVHLRINCTSSAGDVICNFSYSLDGRRFRWMNDIFVAQPGMWIGAKVGLFALGPANATTSGHADYDWFRFSLPGRSSRTGARAR